MLPDIPCGYCPSCGDTGNRFQESGRIQSIDLIHPHHRGTVFHQNFDRLTQTSNKENIKDGERLMPIHNDVSGSYSMSSRQRLKRLYFTYSKDRWFRIEHRLRDSNKCSRMSSSKSTSDIIRSSPLYERYHASSVYNGHYHGRPPNYCKSCRFSWERTCNMIRT